MSKTIKNALVLIAAGVEEIEFTTVVDVLRRLNVSVIVGGVNGDGPIVGSRNITLTPDKSLDDAVKSGPFGVVVLPGGMEASKAFGSTEAVGKLLRSQEEKGGLIAAICAAPLALKEHRIAVGKNITCYPSLCESLGTDYTYVDERVVTDGNIITSQGPATAMDFTFAIAKQMVEPDVIEDVQLGLLYKKK